MQLWQGLTKHIFMIRLTCSDTVQSVLHNEPILREMMPTIRKILCVTEKFDKPEEILLWICLYLLLCDTRCML